ncbi:unnamed protein product, partial [Mycena citricolor]
IPSRCISISMTIRSEHFFGLVYPKILAGCYGTIFRRPVPRQLQSSPGMSNRRVEQLVRDLGTMRSFDVWVIWVKRRGSSVANLYETVHIG